MKRKLVFSALFFTAGIYFGINSINYSMLLLLILPVVIYLLFYRRNTMGAVLLAAVLFFGGDMWASHFSTVRNKEAEKLDAVKLAAELTVADFPENGTFIAKAEINGKKQNLRVWIKECPKLLPGDIIRCDVTLKKPENNKNSTSFNYTSYLGGKNIFLTANAKKCEVTGARKDGIIGVAYNIRAFMAKVSAEAFSGDILGLFNAMIFGDKRFMTDELTDALTAAGLSHIAVVSGMHLSIMVSAITFLLYGFLGRKRISGLIMIAAVIIFTFVTGCGASVVRSCIMCVLCLCAQLLYRESDPLTNLSAATVIMLIYNPYTICNVGFVLSVLSALGIILFGKSIKSFLSFCPKSAAEALAASIAAQVMTVPVVMYMFGVFSPYSLIANVFVFIFSSALVCFGLVFVMLSAVPGVSFVLTFICKVLAMAVVSVAEAVEAIPYSVINTGRSGIAVFVLWFVFLYVVCLCKDRRDYLRTAALCMMMVICMGLYADYENSKIRIYPFYYAAGNTSAVMLPDGNCILTDCVSAYDIFMFAQEHNINKFDYVVVTGTVNEELQMFLESGMVKNIIMHEKQQGCCDDIINAAQRHNIRVIFAESNASIEVGSANLIYTAESDLCTYGSTAMMQYGGWRYALFGQITGKDVQQIFNHGTKITADAALVPNLFEDKAGKLSAILDAGRVNGKKEIVLN